MLSDEKGSSNVFEAGTVKEHNLLLRTVNGVKYISPLANHRCNKFKENTINI